MILVDPRNPKPLHEQIKESVMEQILIGALSSGDRLPSVRETAQTAQIAPNTIQRAYRELENDGVISSYPGRGSYISLDRDGIRERRKAELASRLIRLIGEIKTMGTTNDEIMDLVKGVLK